MALLLQQQHNKGIQHNNDMDCCSVCNASLKKSSNSLHVWELEYECGCRIWGAIDTELHGNAIITSNKCPYDTI